jgi:hypothetical protein
MNAKDLRFTQKSVLCADLIRLIPYGEISGERMTAYVEGWLMGFPYPNPVLHGDRVLAAVPAWKAVAAFCKSGRPLTGLKVMVSLEGCTFASCPEVVRKMLMEKTVDCPVLSTEASSEAVAWVEMLFGNEEVRPVPARESRKVRPVITSDEEVLEAIQHTTRVSYPASSRSGSSESLLTAGYGRGNLYDGWSWSF